MNVYNNQRVEGIRVRNFNGPAFGVLRFGRVRGRLRHFATIGTGSVATDGIFRRLWIYDRRTVK